jgi:hypothetical protein
MTASARATSATITAKANRLKPVPPKELTHGYC